MVESLAKSKGLESASIQYTDADNEWVVIEDDVDLEMAYTIASTAMDKRIKFVVTPAKTSSSAPDTARTAVTEKTESIQMQPQVQQEAPEEEPKEKKGGLKRKMVKKLIQHEREAG